MGAPALNYVGAVLDSSHVIAQREPQSWLVTCGLCLSVVIRSSQKLHTAKYRGQSLYCHACRRVNRSVTTRRQVAK